MRTINEFEIELMKNIKTSTRILRRFGQFLSNMQMRVFFFYHRYAVSDRETVAIALTVLEDIGLNTLSDSILDSNRKRGEKDRYVTQQIFLPLLSANWREIDSSP